MVFKFATFDPAQDPNDYNPAFPTTPPSSPSATLCRPCENTCTFTRAIVSRLAAAGASLVFTAPAFEFEGREIRDESSETQFYSISSNVHPKLRQRQLKEFTLKELMVATQNFSNRKILGRGGFGKVYQGQLADGSLVAIKRCREERTEYAVGQFETEVMLGSLEPQHHNLLPLLGYCRASKCRELLLVYPLMIRRSAASCLRERPETQPPLDWPTRRKIATGAARGLSHLRDLNIVHRDIKAANIMLDEEFEPHIGDCGLAKFINPGGNFVDCIEAASTLPSGESAEGFGSKYYAETTAVRGTIGHMAPEYLRTGRCSLNNDVFGFGIMLLELATGQRGFNLARLANDDDVMLLDWVKGLVAEGSWKIVVDPNLQDERDREEIEKVIQLALLCTQIVPRRRPSMARVVQLLEGHGIEERWQEYCHSDECSIQSPNPDWIKDSSWLIRSEELSGPR